MARPSLVAANWKMNGSRADNARWLQEFCAAPAACETVVCAPYVYLAQVADALRGTRASAGAQNLSAEAPGAFTGFAAAAAVSGGFVLSSCFVFPVLQAGKNSDKDRLKHKRRVRLLFFIIVRVNQ